MSYLIEDCLRIVFTELELNSLYSCILVNRHWCRVAMPILWKRNFDTFDTVISSNSKLYNIIIYLLPKSSKMFLINNNIILPSTAFSYQPLFNYINFSSQVPSHFIKKMIETLSNEEVKFVLEQEIYKLFISNCKNIKYFFLTTTQPLYQFLSAPACFSQLCFLTIDILQVSSTILFGMAIICKNIEELKIIHCDRDIPGLNRFIEVQTKLKSLQLEFNNVGNQCKELSNVIKKKATTLQEVGISSTVISLSPDFLPSLINLRSLRLNNSNVIYDISVEMQEWKKYLSISSFPNLQHFETIDLPFYNDYMLIEKSNGNILEINISQESNSVYHTKKLINTIIKYCPNIERLTIDVEFENLDDIKEILLNCNQLEMINLSLYNDDDLNCDKFFEILIRYSPRTLCKIYFSEEWTFTVNGLKSFFENWKNWKAETLFVFDKVPLTDEHIMIIRNCKVLDLLAISQYIMIIY
jgi:hypothetical protein